MEKHTQQQTSSEVLVQTKSTKPKLRKYFRIPMVRHKQHAGIVAHTVCHALQPLQCKRTFLACLPHVPKTGSNLTLDDLLTQISPDNIHAEIDTGAACGNETW